MRFFRKAETDKDEPEQAPPVETQELPQTGTAADSYYPHRRYIPVSPLDPNIRPLPAPYRGVVSVSNDCDLADFGVFDTLMSFLNTNQETPLGRGLGLNVSSSMFFYEKQAGRVSYFNGLDADAPQNEYASRLIDYIRAGWIDTNHAYGDFDHVGGFTRRHAERTTDVLAKHGARLPLFTNHGDSFNVQNLGADGPHHRGDVVGDDAYHADLTVGQGTMFIWCDGPHVIRPIRRDQCSASDWRQIAKPDPTDVLEKYSLRDGNTLQGFKRLRGTGAHGPTLSSLGYQLDQVDWNGMYADFGALILYQHFGISHYGDSWPGKRTYLPADLELLKCRPEVYLAPFRYLGQEKDAGRLWVPTLSQLLSYLVAVQSIRVKETGVDGAIELESDNEAVTNETLSGVTVYVDPLQPLRLSFRGKPVPFDVNGPDHTGRYSITVRQFNLPNIW